MKEDTSVKGVKDLVAQLTELSALVDEKEIIEDAEKSWSIIRDQIRLNAAAAGFHDTGLLLDPRTILVHAGKGSGGNIIFAEAGVFKDDSAMSAYGLNPKKDMPRGMVAYWLEYGTRDHYVGQRADVAQERAQNRQGKSPSMIRGIKPSKFISRAFDLKNQEAFDDFSRRLGERIDKVIKG